MPIPMPPKNKKEFSWGRFSKTLSFWILILLIPVILIQLTGAKSEASKTVSYTEYRDELEHNNIAKITITAGKVGTGTFRQPANIGGTQVRNFTVRYPVGSRTSARSSRARRTASPCTGSAAGWASMVFSS